MLEELHSRGLIYDVEIYKNCFLTSFYSLRKKAYKTFIIHGCRDERDDLFKLIEGRILIGYNNWNFDDGVINHLLNCENIKVRELWEFSQTLIQGERNPYRYSGNKLTTYDLLEVIRAGFNVISLKNAGVNLKFANIQDLPIDFDKEISDDDLSELKRYNINDLDITYSIFEHVRSRLEMREVLSEKHQLNLKSLSDSGLAKELISKKYTEIAQKQGKNHKVKYLRTPRRQVKLSDAILPCISFNSPVLQNYLDNLKQQVLTMPEEDEDGEEFQD